MAEGMRTSGVGKNAKRIDLDKARKVQRDAKIQRASGGSYGERSTLNELATGAPMPKVAPMGGVARGEYLPTSPQIPNVGIFEPTTRPNEPITAGLPVGDGAGPEVLNTPIDEVDQTAALARAMFAANPTPQLRRLVEAFMQEGR